MVVSLGEPRAQASGDSGFSLEWRPHPGCDGEGVHHRVVQLLGAPPEVAASPPVRASIGVSALPGGLAITVDVVRGDTSSSRTLEVGSCAEAVEAAALILALTIDPNVGSRSPATQVAVARFSELPAAVPAEPPMAAVPEPPPPSGNPLEHPPPPASQSAGPPSAELPPAREPMTNWLSTTVATSVGALPSASPGLGLEVGLGWRGLRFALGATSYARRTAERAGTTATLTVDLWSLDLRAGWRLEPAARWLLVPSGVFQWGQFSGRGNNVDQPHDEQVPWAAAGGGAHLGFRLAGRWRVTAGGDLLFPLQRTRFTLNAEDFHRPARVVGAARCGLSYELEQKP